MNPRFNVGSSLGGGGGRNRVNRGRLSAGGNLLSAQYDSDNRSQDRTLLAFRYPTA